MNILKAFALAWNMLSILPLFKVHDFYKGINGYSAMFYPLVGFLLGSLLWATHFLLQDFVPPLHLNVIIFTLWVVVTGALHIDGFSDSVDGFFVPKEKSLQVMKDSHVGGMGMTFTFVFLALKLSSVIYLEAFYLLPVILMLSRFNAVLVIYLFPYISQGVGQLLKTELEKKHVIIAFMYALALTIAFGFSSALLLAIVTALLCATLFTKRLGGLSGDVYGFIIEVTELILLNYIIVLYFL